MSFSGFSEDDIRKLTKTQDVKIQKGSHKAASKKVTFKPPTSTNHSRNKAILNNITNNNLPTQEIPENAKLNVQTKANNLNGLVKNPQNQSIEIRGENVDIVVGKTAKSKDLDDFVIRGENVEVGASKTAKSKDLDEFEIRGENVEVGSANTAKKFKDLDEFEARQKLIEEQNRKRKELLAKALADRTRQTQEEAQRLNEIHEEFKTLDAMLSCDVKILRKQIEIASIEYMECQKRYHKIEKEFLDAKLLLHQKQEKKEMLTEHLCTIIEKNEERKAEKLNELLKKLELTASDDHVVKNSNE